jgi:hypothetical protein
MFVVRLFQIVTSIFCLKIEPRGSVWAGVELDAGLIINSVPPEEAAQYYRKK